MNIDEIAQNIVSAFIAENAQMLRQETKKMLCQIDINEFMFSAVKRPYLVAKSLYFMLTEDCLTEDEQMSVVKLVYFCLLNNYLKNCDSKPGDAKYEDLVSGCKLAIVLIAMQNKYLMYLITKADYINPQTHIQNQVFLFGGIAKEAEIEHCCYPLEDVINRYIADIFKKIYGQLPMGRNLAILKEDCISVIEHIELSISINLKEPDWL